MKGRTKLLAALLAAICLVLPSAAWAAESEDPPIWETVVAWLLDLAGAEPAAPAPEAPDNAEESSPEAGILIQPGG